ncbi:glucoside xylosyltransferase 2 isoform X1 [Gopherus evgoodei]|uniref:glucoside xylosyltransferase 2 isoform X1 n=1 Tax=Gopherus evgoodei TaxID=1825980 RepID=UPI0011CF963D|nr:glucoside xylosyltransferase 2 isoform X1 [Gopherus evgoodei]XP_030425318.1 glucoside xylosyltransferase 2 isoform X1 [Gopherus evgoodei]
MKLYCKVVAILLCLGTLLLLYLFVGNADEPPLKGAGDARWLPVSSGPGGRAHPLFAHFQPVRAAPEEAAVAAAAQISKREPRLGRNPGKRSPARGKFANVRPGEQKHLKELPSLQWMHLAVVACGNRLEETLIMLKSAVLFSYRKLKFHIFAEDSLKPEFEKKLREWPSSYTKKFDYNIYPIAFSVGNAQEWKKLFKPCAAQRLFLPNANRPVKLERNVQACTEEALYKKVSMRSSLLIVLRLCVMFLQPQIMKCFILSDRRMLVILKDVDSLLYVDTDVLFLRPIDDIWRFLKEFNSTQLAAMAPEHEIPKIGWYSRFARHPYYGTTGVNSGVMLMNLTRIRNTQFKNSMIPAGLMWEEMLYPLYQKYKNYITWGDQDLLNIIFYFNPECLYVFPCQWNYRPDHCMYGSNCKGAEEEGISVLHGNRGVYHDDKQPTFKALYEVIRDFPFEDNLFQSLYYPLQSKFLDTVHTLCGRIPQVFLKQIEKTMKKVYENRVIVHMGANYRY